MQTLAPICSQPNRTATSAFVPLALCSTGLDSTTAYDIMAAMRKWCDETGGVVIASLLQPIPEVFALFDQGAVWCVRGGGRGC